MKRLFRCLGKFAETARFDFLKDGILITGIDSHDFLHFEATLTKELFVDYPKRGDASFEVDMSRLARIVRTLSSREKLVLNVKHGSLELRGIGSWNSTYTIPTLSPNLPTSGRNETRYATAVQLKLGQLLDEVKRAAVVSQEVEFAFRNGKLVLKASSGAYEFESKPLDATVTKAVSEQDAHATVPARYIRDIGGFFNPSIVCSIRVANEKPFRFDIPEGKEGRISFFLSSKPIGVSAASSTHEALASVKTTRLPEFMRHVGSSPRGIAIKELSSSRYETANHDYTNLSRKMGLIRGSNKVRLTKSGRLLVELLNSDEKQAKQMLTKLAIQKVEQYKIVIDVLVKGPSNFQRLLETVNSSLSRTDQSVVSKERLAILVGIATWCGSAGRELDFYYFSKDLPR